MIKIEADALYRLQDLEEILRDHVEISTFLERLGLKRQRVFRDAIWGWEILEASRQARPYAELSQIHGHAHSSVSGQVGRRRSQVKGSTRRLSVRDLED